MNMKKFFYVGAALWAFGLTGCTNDDSNAPDPILSEDQVAINVSAALTMNTRAADDHWDPMDSIGISMFKPNTMEVVDGSFNREYITPNSNGIFNPATIPSTIYFPQDGSTVEFKSYYPYLPTLGSDMEYPVSVANQTNLPKIDLMTSEHVSGTSRATPDVVLEFHHRLTKLVFDIEFEEDLFSLDGGTLVMQGMKTQGEYELYQDVLTVDDNSIANINVPTTTTDDKMTATAIVLPRAAGDGIVFRITTSGGETFNARMMDNLELKSGFQYKFIVKLRKTGVINIETYIVNWNDGGEYELIAD